MDLRYPIGHFDFIGEITKEQRDIWISLNNFQK
jgi:hypothetical protein